MVKSFIRERSENSEFICKGCYVRHCVILRDKVPKNLRILLFTTGDPSSLRSSG
ncbi:MAG TPA: hypothetical protein PKX79_02575 [Spirochaetota bacterium]|nr:hypothetical protein [Spirochaetota bacterium]